MPASRPSSDPAENGTLEAATTASAELASEGAPEGAGLSPIPFTKSGRKQWAMQGLSYEWGRVVTVPSEVQAAIGTETKASLPALLARAHVALNANRALQAISGFTKAVLMEPAVADHYFWLGRALQAFKLETQAIAAWETGHEIDPEHVELIFRVADMAYRYNDRARAVALYLRTLELDSEHAATWGRLARLWYFEEADDKAWEAIHRADDLGEAIPVLMRTRLATRTPEPRR